MQVLGIDPGVKTGMALYDLELCTPVDMWETENGLKGFKPDFNITVIAYNPQHIACENFTLRSTNKFTADLTPVKIIGWLEGQEYCKSFPEPSTHMTLTRLREKKDSYADSVVTKLMKETGFKIGKGHSRMGLSVAMWYAVKVLNHRPTIELLKPKD